MLLERATELANKIGEYQKLKGAADNAEQFRTRAKQLGNLSQRISVTRATLEALAIAGVGVSFSPTEGTGYAAKAEKLRVDIQDNPAAINDPPFNLKYEFMDRISCIAAAADKAMTEAWKTYVAKRADLGAKEVLSALAAVPQFHLAVTKIQQCQKDITDLGNSLPIDPKAAVARMDALVSEHETTWATLSADDIPPKVIAFIRAAAEDGAPLTTYTEEVRAWLKSRNLLSAFRIRRR